MPSYRFLPLSLLLFLGVSSGLLIPEPAEAGGSPSTKVATIQPSLMIPISSCNSLRVFPPQGHGGAWFKPSLEGTWSRQQCVSESLIGKVNETVLYGTFTNYPFNLAANKREYKVRFQVPFNSARYCELEFNLPPSGEKKLWRVRGTGILNVYGLAEPINPRGIHWNVRPRRAPNTRSSGPGSPLYLIEVYTTCRSPLPILGSSILISLALKHSVSEGTTSCNGPRLECRMGELMEFELSVHRPGFTLFDWERKYPYTSYISIKLTLSELADPPTGISLGMWS